MSLAKLQGTDPRRPNEAKKYERPPPPDEPPPDPANLLALVAGVIATMLKVKLAGWVSLVLNLSSFANISSENMDAKQMMTSTMFALMGLVTCYFLPNKMRPSEE